ncbi:ATPase components of ABC transporters with duplicated ATPase domains [Streptococcus sp. 45]|uniref:ATP-binding cassette domain-containing protein n=1 Tax=Streptococcus sp. 45 TaxID=1855326 RepID=UPI0008B87962|nr:ATP-binding cassette domain-containing protein [Streptococcus sp. 45]SEI41324.1 ATPase components of ABC transporters with duplicated ATPase domains [Streptococcus sp. 45]
MLEINQLSIHHLKDSKPIITDLHLIVNPGEKLAIIGEEGTGKSSLLKNIVSPKLIASYAEYTGLIRNQFKKIGYLPQSLSKKENDQTVSDFLYKNMDYLFNYTAFYQMAAQLGLDLTTLEEKNQLLSSLSGGEKLKLQLSKLTGQEADLLLLDEPSSDLDIDSQVVLKKFIQESNKTIIFISHDEAMLEDTATAILHLELLKHRQLPRASYFQGKYQDYLKQRQSAYTKQLQEAKNDCRLKKKRDAKIQRLHQAAQYNVRHTHDSTLGRLAAKKMKNVLSLEKRYQKEDSNRTEFPENMDNIALFFNDISTLDKNKRILSWKNHQLPSGQIINLDIFGQDKLVITGKNGIGKTRLIKQIYHELSKDKQLSLGYMPQDYDSFFSKEISALNFLDDVTNENTARTILACLQFTREEMEHSTLNLSGGQKAKLFLAHMVLAKNQVIILDEPTRHFSPTSQPIIRNLFINYPGCIISVSHDQHFIQTVTRKHYHLTEKSLESN